MYIYQKTIFRYLDYNKLQYQNMEIKIKNNIQILKLKNKLCFTKKSVFLWL